MTFSSLFIGAAVASLAFAGAVNQANAAVVAFTDGEDHGWQNWNFSAITHLGFWTAPSAEVQQKARANGVRLFQDSHLPDPKDWGSSDKRAEWVQGVVKRVTSQKLDGVFFDEEGTGFSADQKKDYTKLAKETAKALEPHNATIFICVGGRPSYEFRNYDYSGLAEHSEFLFIMGYDMHFWDDYTCVTKGTCSPAEASIKDLRDGVVSYKKQVDKSKLVLGLPWYGQVYEKVVIPFNMGQIQYKDVLAIMDEHHKVKSKTLDETSQTWKLVCNGACRDDKRGGEIWFDDAQTLTKKYHLARDEDLLGVGVWQISDAPYPDGDDDPHKAERAAMWQALGNWRMPGGDEE